MVGGGGGGGGSSRELDQTPTWAVSSVCAIIVLIPILLEKVLHIIGKWFTEKRKRALFEPLEKVKAGNLLRSGDIRGYRSMARMYTRLAAMPKKGTGSWPGFGRRGGGGFGGLAPSSTE